MKNHWCNAINLIMPQNKMHNVFAKGQGLQKLVTGYWDQMTFHLLVQTKVYKGETRTMNTQIFYTNRL